jgi:hypothetical protein
VSLSDTSPKASEAYWKRLAEMTPEEKIAIGVALWQAGDSLQRAAIRRDYPDADEDEVTFRLAVLRFGPELARKVYGRE